MNLPNKLTVFRMTLVPVIVLVALLGNDGIMHWQVLESHLTLTHIICTILFLVASFTDMLDGKIARKYQLITTFGKFMDPIADKMLVNSLLILLCYDHLIPVICVILMIARDLVVDAIRLMAAQQQIVLAAGPLGKLKTVIQMVAIVFVLMDDFPLAGLGLPVGQILIWLAVVISLLSGGDYLMKNKHMIFESI